MKSHWFTLSLTFLLLAFAILKYRHGWIPMDGVDLVVPYTSARAWMRGLDPYDTGVLMRIFHEAGGQSLADFDIKYFPPIYPPITLIVMVPLALLPWDRALQAWTLAAPIVLAVLLGSLARLAGLRWNDPRTWLLVLFGIVFSPVRTAVTLAQNALPAVTLAVLAAAIAGRRPRPAGVLLALAIGFKMQDGFFVLLGLALMRHWRAVGWCIGALAVLSLVALTVPLAHPRWVLGMLHWLGDASRPGGIIDPSPLNGARFQMIHLPVLLHTLTGSRGIVTFVNAVVCGSLAIMACHLIAQNRESRPPAGPALLLLATLGVISLLPFYHRFPDAILLLLPMAWAIARLGTPQESLGRITLVLLLPFLLQPMEVIRGLIQGGQISRSLAATWWFEAVIRASAVWLLLLLSCWLLLILSRARRPAAVAPAGI